MALLLINYFFCITPKSRKLLFSCSLGFKTCTQVVIWPCWSGQDQSNISRNWNTGERKTWHERAPTLTFSARECQEFPLSLSQPRCLFSCLKRSNNENTSICVSSSVRPLLEVGKTLRTVTVLSTPEARVRISAARCTHI